MFHRPCDKRALNFSKRLGVRLCTDPVGFVRDAVGRRRTQPDRTYRPSRDRVADTDYAVVARLASRLAGAYMAGVRDVTTLGRGSGVQFKPHWNLKSAPWELAVSVAVDAAYPSAVFLLRNPS